jgi:GDPmannose 4,6-dehydratase
VSSRSLIIGASGQTGAYLAHRLLSQGKKVIATSRDATATNWWRFAALGIAEGVETTTLEPSSTTGLAGFLDTHQPDEIYYLAGPSSVAQSFAEPTEVFRDITQPIITMLDALTTAHYSGTFFNATSTDCFGNQPDQVLEESSPMRPVSPYGVAKAATFSLTKNYRETFGLRASNGMLTNHESPLREPHFVTQKIVSTLKNIKTGDESVLKLGNTSIERDWLWAGDVAHAISLIGASGQADDYLVASGKTRSLDDFVALACEALGLDKASAVTSDPSLHRPMDIASLSFDPAKIRSSLGWSARMELEEIVANLVADAPLAGL